MTDLLSHVGVRHETRNQQTSTSSSEVWAVDLRPLVEVAPWWLDNVLDRAGELYKAGLVRREALVAFMNILGDSLWADAPAPFVSSTDDGGVSAEFEAGSLHLDIEALPSGSMLVYLAERGLHDWEGAMDLMPDGLQKWACASARPTATSSSSWGSRGHWRTISASRTTTCCCGSFAPTRSTGGQQNRAQGAMRFSSSLRRSPPDTDSAVPVSPWLYVRCGLN